MHKYKFLIILIALLLLIKFSILFSLSDLTMITNNDELLYGGIAKEINNGPILPLFSYQLRPWEGGGLIVSVLASLIFSIAGDSLFSLKLVGILFSIGILVTLYLFLYRYFGRRVAILSSILFILSPPTLTQRSLMVFGNHFESILFSFLTIHIFYRIFFERPHIEPPAKYFLLFGLVSGFAIYFCYTFIVTLLVCLIFWFFFDKMFFIKKQFSIFIGFFVIGSSPWIYYNLTHKFSGLAIKHRAFYSYFSGLAPIEILIKFKNFVFNDLLHVFGFDNFGIGADKFTSIVFYLIFLISFCFLIWSNRESMHRLIRGVVYSGKSVLPRETVSKEIFFLVYFILYSLIYSFGNFDFEDSRLFKNYRYVVPVLPFIFIIISLFFAKLRCKTNKYLRIISSFLSIALIAIGIFYNIQLVSFQSFGNIFRYKGFSYNNLGYLIGMRFDGTNLEYVTGLIDKFHSTEYKSDCYQSLGMKIGQLSKIDIRKAVALIDTIDSQYQVYCYYGLGEEVGKGVHNIFMLDNIFKMTKQINKKYQKYFVEGLATGMHWIVNKNIDTNEIDSAIMRNLEATYARNFYRGLTTGFYHALGVEQYIDFIEKLPEEYKPYAYEGLGTGLGDSFLFDDIKAVINAINLVDEKYKAYSYQGLGVEIANVIRDDMNKCTDLISEFEDKYETDCYKGLQMMIEGKRFCRLGFKTELLIF